MNKINKIIIELLPVILSLILLYFFRKELLIIFVILLAILLTFKISYKKGEIYLLFFGIFIGLIFELIGNYLLGQRWAEASFFTIPLWLPLTWGYGFIIIRRIGNLLITK